jgi:hypothetical protein
VVSRGITPKKKVRGHPRYETAPGLQAQVDWKEDLQITNCLGEVFTIQVFDYKLGYSRYCRFVYKRTRTQQEVFDSLIQCFMATGGVPREILFDNMRTIVDITEDGRRINAKAKQFAKDFGFKIKLAKPRHSYTKGKVETINKFMEWLRVYEGEFETEDDLTRIMLSINDRVNTEVCQATNMPPYLLFQKEKLSRQGRQICYALLPSACADRVLEILRLSNRTFSSFLSGQCLEAVILGALFMVAMTLVRLPYALLVGVLISLTALIPIVGAFIGCGVGAMLIAITDPWKALIFIVLFLVLQQIEGNLIYPHVVGSSVGLPSIWVLAAVTLGGKLMGVVGMLVFIPLCSVLYALFRNFIKNQLVQKSIPDSKWQDPPQS